MLRLNTLSMNKNILVKESRNNLNNQIIQQKNWKQKYLYKKLRKEKKFKK